MDEKPLACIQLHAHPIDSRFLRNLKDLLTTNTDEKAMAAANTNL